MESTSPPPIDGENDQASGPPTSFRLSDVERIAAERRDGPETNGAEDAGEAVLLTALDATAAEARFVESPATLLDRADEPLPPAATEEAKALRAEDATQRASLVEMAPAASAGDAPAPSPTAIDGIGALLPEDAAPTATASTAIPAPAAEASPVGEPTAHAAAEFEVAVALPIENAQQAATKLGTVAAVAPPFDAPPIARPDAHEPAAAQDVGIPVAIRPAEDIARGGAPHALLPGADAPPFVGGAMLAPPGIESSKPSSTEELAQPVGTPPQASAADKSPAVERVADTSADAVSAPTAQPATAAAPIPVGNAQPLSNALDAAVKLAADANAAADALESLKRLLQRQLPDVAIGLATPVPSKHTAAQPAPKVEAARPPPLPGPPIQVDQGPGQLPDSEPQLPMLAPTPGGLPERRRFDVRGFLAGFALSWAFGVVLYLFMTAG